MSDDVVINIRGEDHASKAFASARASVAGLTSALGGFGIGIGLSSAVRFVASQFLEAEAASRSLSAALRISGQDVSRLLPTYVAFADSIQAISTVDDETVVGLLRLGTTFGFTGKQLEKATKQALGLSEAFGMDAERALRALARAREGDFAGLTRYIPQLRSATEEADKMNIVNKAAADGFQLVTDRVNTTAGALEQAKNRFGEWAEAVGGAAAEVWNFDPLEATNKLKASFREAITRPNPFLSDGITQGGGGPIGLGRIMGNLGGAIGRPFGRIGENIGFQVMPKINQWMNQMNAQGRAAEAMRGRGRHPLAGGAGSDFVARILSGADPFGGKPKEMDLFDFFKQQAAFIDKPLAEQQRSQRGGGGTFGTSSRFLSTGVGFDPSTQTAKNTAEMVKLLKEVNRKLPAVVGKI